MPHPEVGTGTSLSAFLYLSCICSVLFRMGVYHGLQQIFQQKGVPDSAPTYEPSGTCHLLAQQGYVCALLHTGASVLCWMAGVGYWFCIVPCGDGTDTCPGIPACTCCGTYNI